MVQLATIKPSAVTELRLTGFKSFRDAVLPLDALTLVVGRNGSGKSNALDGLWVLSRLAQGTEIREALDGGRGGPAIRGGVAGCPPFGDDTFSLGCTVRTAKADVRLDVTIRTRPHVQVVAECLSAGDRTLLVTQEADPQSGDIVAKWSNGMDGPSSVITFRADRLVTSQVRSRIPSDDVATHRASAQILEALKNVFVLDPVPHLMRQYVPRADRVLRRDAENLSAAVASLLDDGATRTILRDALHALNEQDVLDISTSKSELGDVMITVKERIGAHEEDVPARVMSDGTLRFLAILTSVMQAPPTETVEGDGDESPTTDQPTDQAAGQTMVVIEELENGLHASQASLLIQLIRDQVRNRSVRALATAHSPAVLDALGGDEHRSVIVCQRDTTGASTLTRLTDLDGYWRLAAQGGLGRAAEQDRLRDLSEPPAVARGFLDDLLRPAGS